MGRGTGGRSGTRGPRKGRRLRAWVAPRASRLHGAVRRCQRLFHAPWEIFLFSWAPAAETGNCLPCRRPEQGEHRGRARGVVCAASLPPSWSCAVLSASFSRSGGNFCQWREGRGDECGERHSLDACDDVTARTRSGRAAYASVTEIVSGRKKSPLSTTAGRGADRRERMHRQRRMQGGRERRFRTPQRTGIRKMSVRCTLGCCSHSQL